MPEGASFVPAFLIVGGIIVVGLLSMVIYSCLAVAKQTDEAMERIMTDGRRLRPSRRELESWSTAAEGGKHHDACPDVPSAPKHQH